MKFHYDAIPLMSQFLRVEMDEIFEFQCGMCDRYVSTANIHIVYNHVKDIHQSTPSFHAKCHHSSCVNAGKHDYRNFLAFKRDNYRMKNQTVPFNNLDSH